MEIEKLAELPPDIEERLTPQLGNEWPRIADDLRCGRSELFSINGGESLAITRYETDLKELVLCAYQGKAVLDFARVMVEVAKKNGALSIRYHTRRKGMARLLAEFGAVETETIYTVTL